MSDELELIQGHVYEAKRKRAVGFLPAFWNDRQLLRVWDDSVQYDSPTVRRGSKYPTMSREKFLKWAGRDVTDEMPKRDWRPAE